MTSHSPFQVGDVVKVLCDYNWESGKIVAIGPKNLKVAIRPGGTGIMPHTKPVLPEKCALPEERVCVVWEAWRGSNGRGGYRVERELYPKFRIPAGTVERQGMGIGRVVESAYGVLDQNFLEKVASGVYDWFLTEAKIKIKPRF